MDSAQDIAANLTSPEGLRNPYPIYERLRREAPVVWSPPLQCWMVTRYADVTAALMDPRFASQRVAATLNGVDLASEEEQAFGELQPYLSGALSALDPPAHTPRREAMKRPFGPRLMGNMRVQIQKRVDALIGEHLDRGTMDLVSDLAVPLASGVIMDIFGVPAEGEVLLRATTNVLIALVALARPAPGELSGMAATARASKRYLRSLIDERRREPREDLLSMVVSTLDEGYALSEEELIHICSATLGAGYVTTAGVICSGMLALLRHPEQLVLLQARPDLIASATWEMLRYDTATHFVTRMTLDDVAIGDTVIPKGQLVRLGLGSANRDPSVFSDPDRFDIQRAGPRPMSFGHGIHYCIGAALARMEIECAIGTMLERLDAIRFVEAETVWRPNYVVRGLSRLLLHFRASRRGGELHAETSLCRAQS